MFCTISEKGRTEGPLLREFGIGNNIGPIAKIAEATGFQQQVGETGPLPMAQFRLHDHVGSLSHGVNRPGNAVNAGQHIDDLRSP